MLLHPVFPWTPWSASPTFAAAMLVPLVIGLVALRTPLAPWLTGQARLRRPTALGER